MSTQHIEIASVQADAVELAQRLIQVDTSNPPGNETEAACVLRDWLAARGVESELVGPDPKRLNLVSSLEGEGTAPSLALCGHLDVVPAVDVDDWIHPPFSGALVNGYIHGRGAVDMKGQVATRAAAFAALCKSGSRPAGDVRLIAQSDEEVNTAGVGMSWVVRNRPDLRTDWALEEGGGRHMTLGDGRNVAFFGVADKALVGLELHVRGPGGHASRPAAVTNPVITLSRLLSALDQSPVRRRLTLASRRSIAALLQLDEAFVTDETLDERVASAAKVAPELSASLDAITRNTFTPTGLRGSTSINVIPAHAAARIDCRALPSHSAEDVVHELHEMIAPAAHPDDDWELRAISPAVGGSASDPDAAFTKLCTSALATLGTDVQLIPMMNPFYTDADHLRSVWKTTTYGFWPWKYTPPSAYAEGIHASNERLLASDIEYAAHWHIELLRSM